MEGKMVMERSKSTHTKSHKHSFIWDERRRILIKATWWDKLSLSDEISFCFSHDFQHRRGEDFFPEWKIGRQTTVKMTFYCEGTLSCEWRWQEMWWWKFSQSTTSAFPALLWKAHFPGFFELPGRKMGKFIYVKIRWKFLRLVKTQNILRVINSAHR